MRDSVALLDQLATFGSGTIADEDAVRLLGGLDTALFQTLLAGDPRRRLRGGGAPPSAGSRRRGGTRATSTASSSPSAATPSTSPWAARPEQVDLPGEEAQALAATARASGYENLLRLLNQLLTSEPIVRRSDTGALAVEIAWLRAAELPKLTRVEEILAGALPRRARRRRAGPLRRRAVRRRPRLPRPAPPAAAAGAAARSAPAPAPRRAAPLPAAPRAAALRRSGAAAEPACGDPITAFKEEAGKRKQNLGGFLDAAEDIRFEDGRGRDHLSRAGTPICSARLEANRAILAEAAAAVWGPGTRLESWRAAARAAGRAPRRPRPPGGAEQQVEQNPTVQAVLEIFGGGSNRWKSTAAYTED